MGTAASLTLPVYKKAQHQVLCTEQPVGAGTFFRHSARLRELVYPHERLLPLKRVLDVRRGGHVEDGAVVRQRRLHLQLVPVRTQALI